MSKKLIWFDVNTPKDALLFSSISDYLKKEGYSTIITARDYDTTLRILDRLNQKYILVGEYGGSTLMGKLEASLKKSLNTILKFKELELEPDLSIHFSSPEAARISFGLSIPSICMNDTPHSFYVKKLSIALSTYLIVTEAIPKEFYASYIPSTKIIQYKGIDVLEWALELKPDKSLLKELDIENGDRFIVFRPEEAFAAYYLDKSKGQPIVLGKRILKFLLSEFPEFKIVLLTRYKEQEKLLRKEFGDRVKIPKVPLLGVDVLHDADLLITGGETMALESAILGTPALTYFPIVLFPTFYLNSKGFPIFQVVKIDEIKSKISSILRDPDEFRVDTSELVEGMIKPREVIKQLIKDVL